MMIKIVEDENGIRAILTILKNFMMK